IVSVECHCVRKVDAQTGEATVLAGTGKAGFNGDNMPATKAQLATPNDIVVDDNFIYIADSFNNRIRRIDRVTGIITTIAGNGESGFSGDGGPAVMAKLNAPLGISVDATGHLFIADTDNNCLRRVEAR